MGELIEFYRPAPKPPKPAAPVEEPEPEGQMRATDILEQLQKGSKSITDILVLMRDDDGQLGFVTNLADMAESLLFIERVKHKIMARDLEENGAPPKGSA